MQLFARVCLRTTASFAAAAAAAATSAAVQARGVMTASRPVMVVRQSLCSTRRWVALFLAGKAVVCGRRCGRVLWAVDGSCVLAGSGVAWFKVWLVGCCCRLRSVVSACVVDSAAWCLAEVQLA